VQLHDSPLILFARKYFERKVERPLRFFARKMAERALDLPGNEESILSERIEY
jgi:hypothetical protein